MKKSMVFLRTNGFIFSAGSGKLSGLFDGYYNPCKVSQPVNTRQQVTVRVRQGITQAIANPQDNIVITIQQNPVVVPSQQNIQNPIRVNQPESVGQEVTVAQIPVNGNIALEQFNRNDIVDEPGATFLLPPPSRRMMNEAINSLGKEVAAQGSTALDLANDTVTSTAANTVDDAARLAAKLKGLSPSQIQQALQKAGVGFNEARNIAATATTNVGRAAELLRQQGFNQLANINRQVVSQVNRVRTSVC